MRKSIGMYRGIGYRKMRICDVLCVPIKARWYFAVVDDEITSDHFRTLTEFREWVDSEAEK